MNTTPETRAAYDLESALRTEAESINAAIASEQMNAGIDAPDRVLGITLDTRLTMQAFYHYNRKWPFQVPKEIILDEHGMLLTESNPVSSAGHAEWRTQDVKDLEYHLGLYEDLDTMSEFGST